MTTGAIGRRPNTVHLIDDDDGRTSMIDDIAGGFPVARPANKRQPTSYVGELSNLRRAMGLE